MPEPPSSTGVVETETEVLGGAKPVEPAKEPRAPLLGRVLGKFTILERLGRGGSGEVFRAEQAQLGRSAVIKVLRSDLAPSPHRVERFLREARLASTLDHPYAAHIYAFGAEPDGLLWIAMEHVRGTTLDEIIARRGPMPPAVFAPLFERLCEVVHSAHELSIIHRDIKLANVMVIERSGQLLPKLLDFGIAKAHGDDTGVSPGADGSVLTGHGATIGSPPYMAPEQWQRPHDVDGRADIYALGVLAYRCLSGRPPIPGASRAELAHAHLHVEPKPLGIGPPALDEAIRKALAKAPDKRWPRAIDFAAAVRKAVGSGAGEAVPILDGMVRDVWERGGPQPIAEAVARVATATTTVECDDAARDLVDVACRWLAAIALAGCKPELIAPRAEEVSGLLPRPPRASEPPVSVLAAEPAEADRPAEPGPSSPFARPKRPSTSSLTEAAAVAVLRERTRELGTKDDAAAWLAIARAACVVAPALPELPGVIAGVRVLDAMAARFAERGRRRRAPSDLADDVGALGEALAPLEPLLAYRLVVGGADGPETWVGARQRSRPRALVWGDAVAVGEVVLLDGAGHIALRLSPLVRAQRPLPHADLELFLIARTGRGVARLAATPWGFEADDEEAGKFLAQLSTADSQPAEAAGDDASPYPGLAAYGVEDAERFFGREREIDALANRLVRAPMVAVVGPSGVGKSSFVHAGLVARLREHYRVITLRPGRRPLEALALAIDRALTGDDSSSSGGGGGTDDTILVEKLRATGEAADRGAVVIVDQLEELVTLCADAPERDRFARILASAAATSTSPVRVIATLRDDFASLLESIDGFRDQFEVFVLGAPSPAALRRILVEPARRAGVELEPGLVEDIVAEIAGRAAALPLLGFTAARLWELRDLEAARLTRSAYHLIGGVAGALATYADEVFARLGKREQGIARDVLARLVAADGTRVPMPRAELASLDAGSGVIDHLIEARLLVVREADADTEQTTEGSASSGDELVEIVHECLAERWPRLVRWRSEDAADRALVTDVRTAARRWDEQRRPDDLLWRGAVLADLRRLAQREGALTAREREFASASLAAARRRTRVRRVALVAVFVGLVGVAGVMAYLMKVAGDNADHAADSERSAREAASLAETRLTHQLRSAGQRELLEGRPTNALAYLGEVLRRGLDDDGIRLMIGQIAWAWPFERATLRETQHVRSTPDGSWTVTGYDHLHFTILDGKGAIARTFDMPTYVSDVVLDRAGKRVLLVSEKVEVASIDALDDRTTIVRTTLQDQVYTGCFGPGDDEVSLPFGVGDVRVYGLDGKVRRTLDTGLRDAGVWECSPGGTHVFVATPTRYAYIDLRAMKPVLAADAIYATFDFAPDGSFIVDAMTGKLEVFGPDGALRATWPSITGPHLVFAAPDGKHVAIASERQIELRRLTDGATVAQMGGFRGGISAVTFVDDDLWSGGNDGVIRRWRMDGLQLAALLGAGGAAREIVRTPSGILAFTEHGARYWDGRPTQIETASTPPCIADYFVTASARAIGGIVCSEGAIDLWDFASSKASRVVDGRESLDVALSANGKWLATWMWNGGLRFWTTADGKKISEQPADKRVMTGGWVGEELWMATFISGSPENGDMVNEVLAYEPATGASRVLPWKPKTGVVAIAGFSPTAAVAFDEAGGLTVLAAGTPAATVDTKLPPPPGSFTALMTLASGGERVAVGSAQTIKVYSLPDLRELHRIDGAGAIATMALDPRGDTLVVVTADRRAHVWSVATGEAVAQLALGELPILEAQFGDDPDRLYIYAGDRLSRVALTRAPGTTRELADEIGCRVPLRPEGGALVPMTPTCAK
jgi:WD40 repeat protein